MVAAAVIPDDYRCESCAAWEPIPADKGGSLGGKHYGVCRRYPPTFAPTMQHSANATLSEPCWPTTAGDDWCYEHRQKP